MSGAPTPTTDPAEFRADIEGLRAIAVLSVVAFHYGSGNAGFLGVDVFFVISGYLITRMIAREMAEGRFSFAAFYARRVRRILPALLLVITVTLVAGIVLLFPADLADLGEQAITAALGLSNFWFFANSGYFDRAAETQPLLHSWSLGVEEQFYLLWPALLFAIFTLSRQPRRDAPLVLCALCLASFAACMWIARTSPEFAFYMLPTRAWQMGVGASLAFAPAIAAGALAQGTAAIGLVLVLGSVALVDPDRDYPSVAALWPVLGAALIVWPKTGRTLAGAMISVRPMMWLGRLSYSLYLWHWPVLVLFLHWNHHLKPSNAEEVGLFLLSLLLAALSFRLVEEPIRRSRAPAGRILARGAVAILPVLALGLWVTMSSGLPGRLGASADLLALAEEQRTGDRSPAHRCGWQPGGARKCPAEWDTTGATLLIGDSHAEHLIDALASAFPEARLHHAVTPGCRPVLAPEGKAPCVAFMRRMFEDVIPAADFASVILAGRWRNGQADQVAATARYLGSLGARVFVLGQIMEYESDLPAILAAEALPRRAVPPKRFERRREQIERIDREMAEALMGTTAVYLSMMDAICPQGACTQKTPDGVPLSYDYGHFTESGADLLVERLKAADLALP